MFGQFYEIGSLKGLDETIEYFKKKKEDVSYTKHSWGKIDILYKLDIERAFTKVKRMIECEGGVQEKNYFVHEARYRRNINRIVELTAPGATLLDVGSHFLHQDIVLAELGYHVIGMDVAEFAGDDKIKKRAQDFKIQNHVVERFDQGGFLNGYEDHIDLVVFTEIQEHITFNPIRFWQRIYHLQKIGGKIYLTTPNSLTILKMINVLKRLFLSEGYGIKVKEILDTVTYGHHWKEYSAYELRLLFETLSPDFDVAITSYQLRRVETLTGPKARIRSTVRRISALFPRFREELEAVITLRERSGWHKDSPAYF